MKLTIGFSPCPNDTFIFFGLLHGKVTLPGYEFEPIIADVEELNQRAYKGELDITKISFNAFLDLTTDYVLLDSGSALGRNCGPLLISREKMSVADLANKTIAIPGLKTTANFLLDYFLPKHLEITKHIKLFSDIEDLISKGEVDAGVIIHENRFTYEAKGLHLIQDLGSHWEGNTGHPIPLGGIIAKREVPKASLTEISLAIQGSIEYAWNHPLEVLAYSRNYAQEMDEVVMKQHIDLYVNDFSSNLGADGKNAVKCFFDTAFRQGRISQLPTDKIFL